MSIDPKFFITLLDKLILVKADANLSPFLKGKYFIFDLQILINIYKTRAGSYCESVIPDPIPNSEVKPFCADGTLS